MPGDVRLKYLKVMEDSLPSMITKHLELTARINPDYLKSKYVQDPLVTKETVVEFNYYLKNAVWEYQMCDHLYDKTLISTYYFRQIMKSLQEDRKFVEDRFTRFKSKKLIFRIFKGSGSILFTRISLVQILPLALDDCQTLHPHIVLQHGVFGSVAHVFPVQAG